MGPSHVRHGRVARESKASHTKLTVSANAERGHCGRVAHTVSLGPTRLRWPVPRKEHRGRAGPPLRAALRCVLAAPRQASGILI